MTTLRANTTENSKLYKAQILDSYYERRATSSIGVGVRFELKKGFFGTSSLVTSNPTGGWDIADIPTNFKNGDLIGKFAECDLILHYNDGVITVRAELQDSSLPEGVPYNFNTLTIMDAENNVVTVLCCQQDTLYKGKNFAAILSIETKVA